MIAMALVNSPALLIADEPTTALDVTVQAQILDLIGTLQTEFNTAVIIITHDLGIVADVADEVVVITRRGSSSRRQRRACTAARRCRTRLACSPRSRAWTASARTVSTRSAATRRRRSVTRRAACSTRAATTPIGSRATPVRSPPELLESESDHYVRCHIKPEERREIAANVMARSSTQAPIALAGVGASTAGSRPASRRDARERRSAAGRRGPKRRLSMTAIPTTDHERRRAARSGTGGQS